MEEDECLALEAAEAEPLRSKKPNSKTPSKSRKNKDTDPKKRDLKSIELSLTKPSYNLQRGRATLTTDLKSLRWLHRNRLSGFLRKLVRRHNWDEVSGVLSVLMKATCKDRSPEHNRTKYLVCLRFWYGFVISITALFVWLGWNLTCLLLQLFQGLRFCVRIE